jgi:signal transduction histidine kinase
MKTSTFELYMALNKILSTTSDLRSLLEKASSLIASTLSAKQAFIFTYLDEGHHMSAGTSEHTKFVIQEARMLDERLHTKGHQYFLEYKMAEDDPLRRMMVSHRIALILPLYYKKRIIGYVCVGKRAKGNYNRSDITALESIDEELVIAIQNAQSVQEVRELNANLEQRISNATKELRTSNAQLQKLDEAKDEFISMASHQLRTPLTSIKGYISMLLEGDLGTLTEEQKHVLNEAFVSSERMVRLIGDFLNVSRLETGRFVIDKHPVDLASLVSREISGLTQNAAAKGVKFSYKAPKNIPIIEVDENKIQQVIMNFADNAIYYSKEKGKVVISLKKVKNFIEFTVQDTGIGVPKAEQAGLFDKFYRASNARKARPDGTGVGLFLAKKVIGDHDGTIIFQSKEGKGSTFGFKLPIAS